MDDYKERMKEEYNELGERIIKLENMLVKEKKGELGFEFNCPVELLREQLDVMRKYFKILEERAKIEGVNLTFSAIGVN